MPDLSRCPQCVNRICSRCDLCAACIPQDASGRPGAAEPAGSRHRSSAPRAGEDYRDPDAPLGSEWGEVWTRKDRPQASSPWDDEADDDDEDDGDLDELGILVAMGFAKSKAEQALQRCGSIELAVEYLMLRGRLSQMAGGSLYGAVEPAADGLCHAAVSLGAQMRPAADVVRPAAARLSEHLQPAANELYEVAGRLGEQVHAWLPWGGGQPEDGPERPAALTNKASDVAATLVELGFPDAQAAAAARRCSSAEAAIEWLAANPGKAGAGA